MGYNSQYMINFLYFHTLAAISFTSKSCLTFVVWRTRAAGAGVLIYGKKYIQQIKTKIFTQYSSSGSVKLIAFLLSIGFLVANTRFVQY